MLPTNEDIDISIQDEVNKPNDEQRDVQIANMLKSLPTKKENDRTSKRRSSTNKIINNANNKFLLEVLSPEIKENEQRKRKHKDWLMIAMGIFLLLQFLIIAIIIAYSGFHIIHCHINGHPFSDETLKIIIGFIVTYITSVVVELIAILKYIVKNVFDTSIVGMANDFKEK